MKSRNYIFISMSVFLIGLTACGNDSDIGNVSSKVPVSFTAGVQQSVSATTRAGVVKAFKEGTKIRFYASTTSWIGHTMPLTPESTTLAASGTSNDISPVLYWDDFGAGDLSNSTIEDDGLSVYALAIDGSTTSIAAPTSWTAMSCSVLTDQSGGVSSKDLLISNNIKASDMKYVKGSEPSANLEFTHAFSKITLNFKMGEGFTDAGFTTPTITLKGFNTSGTLDVTTGNFTGYSSANITKLANETAPTGYKYSYDALVLPGRNLTTVGDILTFTINGNTYTVNTSDIISQIGDDYKTMKSGVNYVVNITVNKTKIKVSAYITDWDNVSADAVPSNGNTISFTTIGSQWTDSFDLYLSSTTSATSSTTWKTGYGTTKAGSYAYSSESQAYTGTILYWPDNLTFYHFRAINPTGTAVSTDPTNGDYVTLETAQTFTDMIWAAPYVGTSTISPAIGASKVAVPLDFYHKMSKVVFQIKTTATNEGGVNLETAPTVTFTNIYKNGCLRLGDGTVDGWTNLQTTMALTNGTWDGTNNWWPYSVGVVPQNTSTIGLKIETSDHNIYPITDLSTIKDSGGNAITAWKPGIIYTYTLTLKKSGIGLTVKLTDWKNVSGANDEVKIK